MKDIFFTVDASDGKVIEMNYLPNSRKLFIWLDKEHEKPTKLDIDYENMAKTKENFYEIFNGSANDILVRNAWTKFSNLLNPCVYEYYKTHKGNGDDGNGDDGNGDGNGDGGGDGDDDGLTDEYAKSLNDASRADLKSDEDELEQIPNRDYSGFVINTIKKEVKRDDVLIRQVFYTGISAYTYDPINLGIISPTSEGKSYTTMKVMQYFPKEDIWVIGQMSNKALIRQKGILINSKGESIQKQVDELKEKLRNITTAEIRLDFRPPIVEEPDKPKMTLQDKVNQRRAEVKKKLDTLLDDAITLIDLQGKILLFLEPPQRELWNLIKPILSHDTTKISYDYAYGNERGGGIQTQRVVVSGFPACIFCSAKDESR
jgi:hypothetical protein